MIPIKTIEAIIAEIDRKLSEQINLILHHEDFQKFEGEWRGPASFSDQYRNRYFTENQSITYFQKEVVRNLKRFKGTAWDQSPPSLNVFMRKNTANLAVNPFGCLVGDYYFDHSAPGCRNAQ